MQAKSGAAPRQRLLEAADKLFYDEGIHTVGIDRVIEAAGVAKASLYSTFGSKDGLICEYLSARLARRRRRVEEAVGKQTSARARLLAVFDVLIERVAEPGFRGCAFVRAAAEGHPDAKVRAICSDARAWQQGLFVELGRAAGAPQPERLARKLALLYDGATVAVQMEGDIEAASCAREAAEALLDAALTTSKPRARAGVTSGRRL